MAQRYKSSLAHERMEKNTCPECGEDQYAHSNDPRFWVPRACSLLPAGVEDRIAQYFADKEAQDV